jgi:hypothetical protein
VNRRAWQIWGAAGVLLASTVPALVNSAPVSVALHHLTTARLPDASVNATVGARPFAVGERLTYNVNFGFIKVGSGYMEVAPMDTVRGQVVWHTVFRTAGGTFFYHVDDVLESWFDTASMSSLRFVQHIHEGGYIRFRTYEIYPERAVFVYNQKPEQPSVPEPLDDGSFLYFIRTLPLVVGETYTFNRYFDPRSNPVTIHVLRRERVTVPAGTFNAIVVQPIIKTKGIFSKDGEAQVWFSDDSTRLMLQMKSKLSFGSIDLYLRSYDSGHGRKGGDPAPTGDSGGTAAPPVDTPATPPPTAAPQTSPAVVPSPTTGPPTTASPATGSPATGSPDQPAGSTGLPVSPLSRASSY